MLMNSLFFSEEVNDVRKAIVVATKAGTKPGSNPIPAKLALWHGSDDEAKLNNTFRGSILRFGKDSWEYGASGEFPVQVVPNGGHTRLALNTNGMANSATETFRLKDLDGNGKTTRVLRGVLTWPDGVGEKAGGLTFAGMPVTVTPSRGDRNSLDLRIDGGDPQTLGIEEAVKAIAGLEWAPLGGEPAKPAELVEESDIRTREEVEEAIVQSDKWTCPRAIILVAFGRELRLLDEDELLQEIKSHNEQLVAFLASPPAVAHLVRLLAAPLDHHAAAPDSNAAADVARGRRALRAGRGRFASRAPCCYARRGFRTGWRVRRTARACLAGID
mgnify:CR=1 FL=1